MNKGRKRESKRKGENALAINDRGREEKRGR